MKQQDLKQVTEYAERLAALCYELAGFSDALAVGPDKIAIVDVCEKMGEPLETLRYISRYGSITARDPDGPAAKRPYIEALDSTAAACNTECLPYALGTCKYSPNNREGCPRYREIYPERVGRK